MPQHSFKKKKIRMSVFEFMIPLISIQLCGRWRQNIHFARLILIFINRHVLSTSDSCQY